MKFPQMSEGEGLAILLGIVCGIVCVSASIGCFLGPMAFGSMFIVWGLLSYAMRMFEDKDE